MLFGNDGRKVVLFSRGVRASLRRDCVPCAQLLNDLLVENWLLLAFEDHALLLSAHVTDIVHIARLWRLWCGAHLVLGGLALADLAQPLLDLRLLIDCSTRIH